MNSLVIYRMSFVYIRKIDLKSNISSLHLISFFNQTQYTTRSRDSPYTIL